MHPSEWNRKCLFSECATCPECGSFRWPSAPPSLPLRLTADTSDIEPFFASFGIAPLPLLSVAYSKSDVLVGSQSRYARNDATVLQTAPKVTWDATMVERAIVLMMDVDAGGRASADGARPGPLGPYVTGLWTDCRGGTSETCRSRLVAYRPPDVRQGTDRIVFLLLRHPDKTWLRGVSTQPFTVNLTSFFHDNYASAGSSSLAVDGGPVLAYNFFYLSGSSMEKKLDPQRWPPWDAPPPRPPPPPPWRTPDKPRPPPPPSSPSRIWWGGTNSRHPWEKAEDDVPARVSAHTKAQPEAASFPWEHRM